MLKNATDAHHELTELHVSHVSSATMGFRPAVPKVIRTGKSGNGSLTWHLAASLFRLIGS